VIKHQELDFRSALAGIFLGLAAAAVGGCALLDSRPPEEVLKERAQVRWDALVTGDIKGAYQFLSPGSRAVLTSEAYASTIRAGFWKTAVVERVSCEKPDVCDVHGAIEYDHRGSRIKSPVKETWIKEGSSWWFVQK
jgi:hypothetical protein